MFIPTRHQVALGYVLEQFGISEADIQSAGECPWWHCRYCNKAYARIWYIFYGISSLRVDVHLMGENNPSGSGIIWEVDSYSIASTLPDEGLTYIH